jgi:hypothetical protein
MNQTIALIDYEGIRGQFKSHWHIPYETLLRTVQWDKFRQRILHRDNELCQFCNVKATGWYQNLPIRDLNEEELLEQKLRAERLAEQKRMNVELYGFSLNVTPRKTIGIIVKKPVFIHIHHKYYILSKLPWEYDDNAVMALCNTCHFDLHKNQVINVYEDDSLKKLIELTQCDRCFGSGFLEEFMHYMNGICFKCSGRRYLNFI